MPGIKSQPDKRAKWKFRLVLLLELEPTYYALRFTIWRQARNTFVSIIYDTAHSKTIST
jgi:hypothetical protein